MASPASFLENMMPRHGSLALAQRSHDTVISHFRTLQPGANSTHVTDKRSLGDL